MLNQKIQINEIAETLWCGMIKSFEQDLLKHQIILTVKVTESSVTRNYVLRLSSVINMNMSFEYPDDAWDEIELTEVYLKEDNGVFMLEFDLWSSGNIEIKCKHIECLILL